MKIGAVITAAGLSSRMGDFKPLMEIGGRSAVKRLVGTLRQAGAAEICIVTGHRAAELEAHLRDEGVHFVRNERYAETQMFDSVCLGFEYMKNRCDALLFAPVDVPAFSAETAVAVLNSSADIAIPVCGGKDGHPLKIRTSALPAILAFNGDGGLRGAIEHSGAALVRVSVEDLGAVNDMDTPEDYARVQSLAAPKRTIWLVRHGEPEFPDGVKCCLGQETDLPLSVYGTEQAARLADYFADKDFCAVYSSPLTRAVQTAEIIAGGRFAVRQLSDLMELAAGQWEIKTFAEIRAQYPELVERRGRDNSIPPAGGESFAEGCERIMRALAETEGNCVIACHASLNRSILCRLTGLSYCEAFSMPQPYGCVNVLEEKDGVLSAVSVGVLPNECPKQEECQKLFERAGTPEKVIRHCKAVSLLADEIAAALNKNGKSLDTELTKYAALLHDICRQQSSHAAAGAVFLRERGYEKLSEIVRVHHDLPEKSTKALDEAAVVYFADKLVKGETRVSVAERFSESREKCESAEALAAHDRRYKQALNIRDEIERITGVSY